MSSSKPRYKSQTEPGRKVPGRKREDKEMENKDLHEMYEKLMEMGATKEDIIALYKIALETSDKIIKNS